MHPSKTVIQDKAETVNWMFMNASGNFRLSASIFMNVLQPQTICMFMEKNLPVLKNNVIGQRSISKHASYTSLCVLAD